MDLSDAKKQLANNEFFTDFAAEDVEAIAAAGEIVEAAAGDDIIVEGTNGDYLCILLSGKAEVTKTDSRGDSHHLDWAGPDDLMGELGLLLDHPRSANVQASEPVTYYRLTREQYEGLLNGGNSAGRNLLSTMAKNLARRQKETNERLIELLQPKEVAQVDLSDLKRRFGRTLRYI